MFPGGIYHVYNHANGHENLFVEERNYPFFLGRLDLHVLPICDLFAYCLMPNHFHLQLRINESRVLTNFFNNQEFKKLKEKNGTVHFLPKKYSDFELIKKVSKRFSNAFSSYTQAFNKVNVRKGSLFMPNMKEGDQIP